MKEYWLSDDYLIGKSGGSSGVQEKYYREGYWYKVDAVGREGLTEHLVSLLLRKSSLPKSRYAYYEWCKINGRFGCRSKSFLGAHESFISMGSLCSVVYKKDLDRLLYECDTVEQKLSVLLNLGKDIGMDLSEYLKTLLLLDMLICNRDRHIKNFGVIFNNQSKVYRIAPVFDNGQSLNTGLTVSSKTHSCTISGSYESQVTAFGYPVQSAFYINYPELLKELKNYKGVEVKFLENQLEKYEGIFKQKGI